MMPIESETACAYDAAPETAQPGAIPATIPASRRELLLPGADGAPGLLDLAAAGGDEEPSAQLPGWVRDTLAGAGADLRRRPDPDPARATIAGRHGRSATEVLLTSGVAEAYALLARAARPSRAVVVHPQLTPADAVLGAAGIPVEQVVLDESDGFAFDPAVVPGSADLVVIANPMNPTGVLSRADALTGLLRPGRVVVVDERLADAVPGERESLAGRSDVPGVIVLRGLPSVWRLAGVRAGYLLGGETLIDELAAVQVGCPLSAPALSLLEAGSSPAALEEARTAAERLASDRAYLLAQLRQLPGIRVIGAPRADVLVARVRDGRRLRERLAETGRAVDLLGTVAGLGVDHVQVPVGDHLATARLVAALEATLR